MLQLRKTALFASCIFFTVLGLSQTSEWQEYVYAEDGFAISAPLKPWGIDDTRQPENTLVGHSYLFPLTREEQKGSAYRFRLEATRRRDIDHRTPEQLLKEAKTSMHLTWVHLSSMQRQRQ